MREFLRMENVVCSLENGGTNSHFASSFPDIVCCCCCHRNFFTLPAQQTLALHRFMRRAVCFEWHGSFWVLEKETENHWLGTVLLAACL